MKSDQWITTWWAKFELECLLLIFIYFNLKFKVICKTRHFEWRYIRTHIEEKTSTILTLHSPFCIKMFQLSCFPEYFIVYFSWWNHQISFKMIHSSPKNATFRVHQFQVFWLHTTHLGPLHSVMVTLCLAKVGRTHQYNTRYLYVREWPWCMKDNISVPWALFYCDST